MIFSPLLLCIRTSILSKEFVLSASLSVCTLHWLVRAGVRLSRVRRRGKEEAEQDRNWMEGEARFSKNNKIKK